MIYCSVVLIAFKYFQLFVIRASVYVIFVIVHPHCACCDVSFIFILFLVNMITAKGGMKSTVFAIFLTTLCPEKNAPPPNMSK